MLHNSLLPLVSSLIVRPVIFIAYSLGGLIVKQVSVVACFNFSVRYFVATDTF